MDNSRQYERDEDGAKGIIYLFGIMVLLMLL